VGLFIAVAALTMIEIGIHHDDGVQGGISIGFTAFALTMVAAAYECRSEKGTVLTGDAFNSRRMNLIAHD
jgi:Ca2+-transporting ATPase